MDEKPRFSWHKVRNALAAAGVFAVLFSVGRDWWATANEAAWHRQCKNNLQQIGLAMHNYHDKYGSLPPAYLADANGQPMHSWRVLLLPFLGQQQLYDSYRFDEPWDGPHNRALAAQSPAIYRCPADAHAHPSSSETNYFVIVVPETVFPYDRPIGIEEITDGTSNTLLVVEAINLGINWMQPQDLEMEQAAAGINPKTGPGISSRHVEGTHMTLADGSVRLFSDDTSPELLMELIERCDGKVISVPAN